MDFDQLIGGDALDITLKGTGEVMVQALLPGDALLTIKSIGSKSAMPMFIRLLSVKVETIFFSYADGSEGPEIGLSESRVGYCLSKNNETTVKMKFKDYEDGTALYYAY